MITAILRALARRYMDVTIRSGADYIVHIVERPGMWMPPDQLAGLSTDLRSIAARTLNNGDLSYGIFSGDPTRMGAVIITLVSRPDGTPIAFNALAVMTLDTAPHPTEVLHLGLVMVDPAERQRNLSWVLYGLTCFLIFFRRQFRPVWISNVTQVPAVVGMVAEMFSYVWPRPGKGRRTLNHLLLARQILAKHRSVFGVGPEAEFDEERFVITNAYTGGSDDLKKKWEDAPKHRDERYNDFCAEQLDYERGDDVIQLGQMDLSAMRTYLSRAVPKSAVLGLLVLGSLVALRRVVLPIIYWSDSRTHFATLRPWKAPTK